MQQDVFLCLQLLFLSRPQTRVGDLLYLDCEGALFLFAFFQALPRLAEALPHRIESTKLRAHPANGIHKSSESIQQSYVGLRLEQLMMLVLAIDVDGRAADIRQQTEWAQTAAQIDAISSRAADDPFDDQLVFDSETRF